MTAAPVSGSCHRHVLLVAAVSTGMCFAFLWRQYADAVVDQPFAAPTNSRTAADVAAKTLLALKETAYRSWLQKQGLRVHSVLEDTVSFASSAGLVYESDWLRSQVPVLCLVLSKKRERAAAVSETWGRRCNDIVFFASYSDSSIPVQRYSSLEPAHVSFCKILLRLSHQVDVRDFKWLLISEDSAFVVVENIRKFVAPLDHSALFYLGRPVKRFGLPPYNPLDSGILLSQGSLRFLMTNFFSNVSSCEKHHIDLRQVEGKTSKPRTISVSRNFETSISQLLLTHNNTSPCDTRDARNRAKFLPFAPEKHLIQGAISLFNSFWRQNIFSSPIGVDCCSPEAISFNGFTPSQMHLTNYLLYHVSVFRNSPIAIGNRPVP